MTKTKIFMVGNSPGYASWFPLPYELTYDKNDPDVSVVWFIGGADVNPIHYNEKRGPRVYVDEEMSRYEYSMWNHFKDKNILKIGVCKGSQSLCAFNGGKVVQHMRHPGYHNITTNDNLVFEVISTHHNQMIVDEKVTGLQQNIDYELVAWADKLSQFHLNGEDKDYNFPADYKEPEIVYFNRTRSLAIQSHPEMMEINNPFVQFCQVLTVEKLIQK